MKHWGPLWHLSKIVGVGGHLLPCVYDAWAANVYPVFPRLQDVLSGEHPDVEALIRQAYAAGADMGYRLPNPSPDGKEHYPAWSSYPRRTFELWEKGTHVRVFSIEHAVQKALPANHAEVFAEICANVVAAAGGGPERSAHVEL